MASDSVDGPAGPSATAVSASGWRGSGAVGWAEVPVASARGRKTVANARSNWAAASGSFTIAARRPTRTASRSRRSRWSNARQASISSPVDTWMPPRRRTSASCTTRSRSGLGAPVTGTHCTDGRIGGDGRAGASARRAPRPPGGGAARDRFRRRAAPGPDVRPGRDRRHLGGGRPSGGRGRRIRPDGPGADPTCGRRGVGLHSAGVDRADPGRGGGEGGHGSRPGRLRRRGRRRPVRHRGERACPRRRSGPRGRHRPALRAPRSGGRPRRRGPAHGGRRRHSRAPTDLAPPARRIPIRRRGPPVGVVLDRLEPCGDALPSNARGFRR